MRTTELTRQKLGAIFPGLLLAGLIAMAAQFLSDHYGAPVMLMAILLGIPFQFLSEEDRTAAGISFASRTLLRIGVALLGVRVGLDLFRTIGYDMLALVAGATLVLIVLSVLAAPLIGRSGDFGFLTGGAVAICGASAAMAIASILPAREHHERDLAFTVISVTVLSTVAMIAYPVLCTALELDTRHTGVFLGATIHDVAQVVGAGYSIDDPTGDIATLVKLFRVTLLAPIVFVGALIMRSKVQAGAKTPPLVPGFVLVFLALAAANSAHIIPEQIVEGANILSRGALVTAVAAVGMRTSLVQMRTVGKSAIALIAAQTTMLALFILVGVVLL